MHNVTDTYGDLSASLSILSYPSSNSSGPCLGISRYQWKPQQCSQQHRFICECKFCCVHTCCERVDKSKLKTTINESEMRTNIVKLLLLLSHILKPQFGL